MRCQLTSFIYQAALMDFSKVFTVLHFQFLIANLSKVMLPQCFQLKTLVWGGIVAYWNVFQDEFQDEGIDSPEGNVKTSNCTLISNFVT